MKINYKKTDNGNIILWMITKDNVMLTKTVSKYDFDIFRQIAVTFEITFNWKDE